LRGWRKQSHGAPAAEQSLILRGEAIPAGASVVTTTMATITDAMRMALAPFELSGEPDATLRSGFPAQGMHAT
jgi:hypothetical protein